jgi:hypothetical protein
MGGPDAPVDLATGQRTQSWLAASNDAAAMVSGNYWYQLEQHRPAREAMDLTYQNRLLSELASLTGVPLA